MADTQEVDFLIIGSGAAALSAAIRAHDLGASVLVTEKNTVYGGSSAMSGGVCWVGNNPQMAPRGIPDSDDDVLTYLRSITKGEADDALLKTYVTESKRMLSYMKEHTHLHFDALEAYTDYYPEAPGGRPGGRSMEPLPFDGGKLGEDFALLHPPAMSALVMGKFMITARMAQKFIILGFGSILVLLGQMIRYLFRARARRRLGRDPHLTNGNALMGRLRLSLKDRGVPLWLGSPVKDLVVEGDRVVGAVVQREGRELTVRAHRGVLIASGGFERNLEMREKYGPAPASVQWTAGNETNTGDGIEMGMALGGDTALMDDAWWTPTTHYPGADSGWVLVVEKSLPGGIFINGEGRRFTNEAAPYVDVVRAMYDDHQKTGNSVPGWMVFDATYRRNYIAGPVGPGKAMPDSSLPRKLRKKFLVKAASVAELAAKLEVPSDALEATIERFNTMSREGRDDDFGRGESASDRYYGDPRVKPNPCMAPLAKAPYYAIPLFPGDLGTKGGLRMNRAAQVLREDGSPIDGLYVAGNASASIMARTYPGAGGTIGPALTFGFIAAESACAEREASLAAE